MKARRYLLSTKVFSKCSGLGDQAPTNQVIEKNPTNVLKVYKDIL
jgi:hypothetical protein